MPPAVLLTMEGDHVPLIALSEAAGSKGGVAPVHISVSKEKAGVTSGCTVTVTVTGIAHCPAPGVKT